MYLRFYSNCFFVVKSTFYIAKMIASLPIIYKKNKITKNNLVINFLSIKAI